MIFYRKKKRTNLTLTFGDLIGNVVDEYGLGEELLIQQVQMEWAEIVGAILAAHSKPVSLDREVLTVHVDHPVFSSELVMIRNMIIEKMERIMHKKVRDLKVKVCNITW